jgi:hypothetical protein
VTADEFQTLVEAGVLGPVELLDGRVVMSARYEVVFSPEQALDAAKVGVRVPSCADEAREDAAACGAPRSARQPQRRKRVARIPPRLSLRRVRRFLPGAYSVVQDELGRALRSSAAGLRSAWARSEPGWFDPLPAEFADDELMRAWQEESERARRQRGERRRRFLAARKVEYEGELYVRPLVRGILLTDLPDKPDIDEWVPSVLGLDNRDGDRDRVRITIEPLDEQSIAEPDPS